MPVTSARILERKEKIYLYDLLNRETVLDAKRDEHPSVAGAIWAAAFWEIRMLLGQEEADKLLCSAWQSTRSSASLHSNGQTFVRYLIRNAHSDGEGIRKIFERRGFKLGKGHAADTRPE